MKSTSLTSDTFTSAQVNPSVVLLSGVRGDTRRYRTFHPYEQLQLAGVVSQLSHITDPDLPAKLERAEIAIFHRVVFDSYVARLLDKIRARKRLAVLDSDDLLFDQSAFAWIDSPDFQDPVRAALYQEDMRRSRMMLDACEAVITSTEYLAELARRLGKPAWIHRNAFSLEMLALADQAVLTHRPQPGKVILGYASGTPTHDKDFAVARPAIQQVMQRFSRVELWLVGPLDPGSDWGELHHRVHRYPLVPWRELASLLVQFDINLAPLVTDNPFAQSKSEIKYVEAGLVKVPTIASPTEAFRIAIQDGQNGFLAQGTQQWVSALSQLVESADLRNKLGQAAHRHVLEKYHPALRARELVATLTEIQQACLPGAPAIQSLSRSSQPESDPQPVGPGVERHPTLFEMGLYTLRYRGLRTLAMQIWIFLRRALAPIWPYAKKG